MKTQEATMAMKWAIAFMSGLAFMVVPVSTHAGLLGKLMGGAAGAAARAGSEKKTYGPDVLRPDQLKECLLSAHSIDLATDKMKTDHEAIEADRKQLDDQVAALKNVSSKDKRVVAYRASEKDFNTRVRAFNENIAKVKADSEKYNMSCAGKKHYVSDFNVVIAQLPPDVRKQATQK